MTFKKEFDEIVIDLCGKLPSKKRTEKLKKDLKIVEGHYEDWHYRQLENERFNPRHSDLRPLNLIQKMCHKTTHICRCKKKFNIWVYTIMPQVADVYATANRRNFEMDQILSYKNRNYFCMFCGNMFCVLNGDILRIELIDEEVESYYHRR